MSGMHPTLVLGLVGSFLWFFGVAVAARRTIGVALLCAVLGLAEWFALLFVFNVIPKIVPFADLPLLAFMGMRYFVVFGLLPASLLVFLSGIWLKSALTNPASRLGKIGKRAPASASPAAGWAMDILFPIFLSVLIFFGAEAYINADGGPSYYRLGMIKSFQIALICIFLYSYLVRRLFKKLWPHWWPPSPNSSPSRDV